MRWTEGVGHSARPYSNTWKPYSQSLDTLGCRRRHMPWRRAPGRDAQQPFDACGSTVGNSLGQAHARFWSWRSRKWWQVRTRKGTSNSYCPPAGSWTSCGFIPGLWKPGTGRWSSGWQRGGYVANQPWYAGRQWNCSSGWRSRLWTWKAPKSWRWPASAWRAYCGWEKRPRCAPVHVETSVSTAKKGGQASGMWRSGHGQSGGYCSSGKSDESNTGVPTCPFPSRTRQDYRQDGKRLLEAWTSKGTGGMHCVGVGRRSYGAPASRRSCSQEGGSLPVSPRITATRRARGPAKDGCTSRFRWTGGGGGRAERSSTGQKNDLWTVCGQDGSERICETLHLSDALGLRRVRSAQRDGKEANPWSPRVPRAQSTTASPAANENTGSWSVTGDMLGGFGGQVERLMRLPDVPR